jgi:hypothetical protein
MTRWRDRFQVIRVSLDESEIFLRKIWDFNILYKKLKKNLYKYKKYIKNIISYPFKLKYYYLSLTMKKPKLISVKNYN